MQVKAPKRSDDQEYTTDVREALVSRLCHKNMASPAISAELPGTEVELLCNTD
jgi:hypothetical protein